MLILQVIEEIHETYFELEDNIIDKKLQKYIDDMTFSSKKNVKEVIN